MQCAGDQLVSTLFSSPPSGRLDEVIVSFPQSHESTQFNQHQLIKLLPLYGFVAPEVRTCCHPVDEVEVVHRAGSLATKSSNTTLTLSLHLSSSVDSCGSSSYLSLLYLTLFTVTLRVPVLLQSRSSCTRITIEVHCLSAFEYAAQHRRGRHDSGTAAPNARIINRPLDLRNLRSPRSPLGSPRSLARTSAQATGSWTTVSTITRSDSQLQ